MAQPAVRRAALVALLVCSKAGAQQPVVPVALTPVAQPQVRTVATIGADTVITDEEVWQMVRQRLIGGRAPDGTPAEQKNYEKAIFREELRALIERELILGEFVGKIKKANPRALDDLTEMAKQRAADKFRAFKEHYKLTTDEQLAKALATQGISYPILSRQLERGAMLEMYLSQALKDIGKTVSLREIERYYADHPKEFAVPDKVVWMDLFVSHARFNTPADTKLYAGWLSEQARAGADFAGLVEKYGMGDSTLRHGLGVGETPETIRPAELAAPVLALKPGEVSGLVPTATGIHVLKVTERQVAGVRPFDTAVQGAIREKLQFEAKVREKERVVEDLWRKTTVSVVDL